MSNIKIQVGSSIQDYGNNKLVSMLVLGVPDEHVEAFVRVSRGIGTIVSDAGCIVYPALNDEDESLTDIVTIIGPYAELTDAQDRAEAFEDLITKTLNMKEAD